MSRVFAWLSALITALGVVSLCVAIWVGLPISGIAWLASEAVRAGLIAGILGLLLLGWVVRWRARRKAAADLEDSLLATQAGDGPVLAERMRAALVRLKKTGGAAALYDLPWYILIGPPGAGKTTALVHSGLEFPGAHAASISGFGGTKNCDFWFTNDAVMIDTAGRYTTQDSDAEADATSWTAFLTQLKTARPDQPINGVILAFSCEDMMTESADALGGHAAKVRARLAELNDAFRTHVPVYVIFTKADMIAGFREYFGNFDEARRKVVWGATFQTRNRREETHRAVAREFDQLVSRLSDEVTDRLVEEPDTAARIAIFGFPEQIALLERNVTTFLSAVFEKPQQIRAILRGFYFTSGTQGGTPIDQVLGAMSARAGGPKAGFLSGKGKSYFLHDLLTRVIFAERDWVGYDRGRVVRRAIARGVGKAVITVASVSVMGILGYSFWTNATLVRAVAGQTALYQQRAEGLLGPQVVNNATTRVLLPALGTLRAMPAGYANRGPQDVLTDLGLSRRESLRGAAVQAYSDSLEQLLRPRMMLHVENDLAQFLEEDRKIDAYRALKVYILLAKEQDGREDDLAVQTYFAQAWAEEYSAPGLDAEYRAINAHLAAMLELDSRVTPLVGANGALIARVRAAVADVPLAERAYGAIRSRAGTVPPLRLAEAWGDISVFGTTDGRPLETLEVPGLFTYEGYWGMFEPSLADAAADLQRDAWVLGAEDVQPAVSDAQLAGDVRALYARDFERVWAFVLNRVVLVDPLANMGVLADPDSSPLVRLAGAVGEQTWLTSGKALKNKQNFLPSSDMLTQAGLVERPFLPWRQVVEGAPGARPVDGLLDGIARAGDLAVTGRGDLGQLLPETGPYPAALLRLIGQVRAALSADVMDAQLLALDKLRCVPGGPPVGGDFAGVFGYGGQLEQLQAGALGPVSVDASARFAAAQAVREAFFAPGAPGAVVPFSMRLVAVAPEPVAVRVSLGAQVLDLVPGADGLPVVWSDSEGGMALEVEGAPAVRFDGGAWSILDFLPAEYVQSRGGLAQVTHRIGPHVVTFGLEFEGGDVPFLMQSFAEIMCSDVRE